MKDLRCQSAIWIRVAFFASLIIFGGCSYFVSWDQANRSSIGQPIDRIINLSGKPDDVWKREDGMTIYKYHLKKVDPSCVHYWIVNDQKLIVDFYYEGACHPIG